MVYCAGKLIENLKLVNHSPWARTWFTSFSRVLPTSHVGYHAGKPIESVAYCLMKLAAGHAYSSRRKFLAPYDSPGQGSHYSRAIYSGTTDCTESLKNIDAHQIPVVQHAVGVFTCSRGQYLCNNSLWNWNCPWLISIGLLYILIIVLAKSYLFHKKYFEFTVLLRGKQH